MAAGLQPGLADRNHTVKGGFALFRSLEIRTPLTTQLSWTGAAQADSKVTNQREVLTACGLFGIAQCWLPEWR